MAPSVADWLSFKPASLLPLLEPAPGRLEFATRLALICALTVLVTEIYQTPEPALAVYIVFFLNRPDRTTSLLVSVGVCVLASIVVGFLVLLARGVADDPMWRVISIALLSLGFLFLASASKLRPIGGTLALVMGFALDVLGMIQLGEEATRGLLYAWLFVGIPAGVSLVVNLVLAPAPRRLAEQALACRLRDCARLLRAPEEATPPALKEHLAAGIGPILKDLRLAGLEHTIPAGDRAALRQAAGSCWLLLTATTILGPGLHAVPLGWRSRAAQTLDEMAGLLEHGQYPLAVDLDPAPATGLLAERVCASIRRAIIGFAEGDPEAPASAPHPEKGGFFVPDAFTNRDHVRYALRTTAAALFCYALYTLLDWPGIHTCFITCFIVAQTTAAESVEKLTLRMVGCLIGSILGIAVILYVVPSLTWVGSLMVTVFLGAWASGYVAAGSPRISYAGFQIAFAFFLCVIQGTGPSLDVVVARDRIVGILIGNLVAYVALTRLWPVSVGTRVDSALETLLRQLSRLIAITGETERRVLASDIRAGLAAVKTDIDLAAYEPGSVRPSHAWLAARREAVKEASALTGWLLIGCEQGLKLLPSRVAERLQHLATRLASEGAAWPPAPTEINASSLQTLIDAHLGRLEQLLTQSVDEQEIPIRALP
jgi:multidrug resistance protein MdtO